MRSRKLKYLRYNIGDDHPNILIDAVHAHAPRADKYTGEIVECVANTTGCNCIIGTVSRDVADLNRPIDKSGNPEANKEYRNTIRSILMEHNLLDSEQKLKEPFLHLAIHGMKDSHQIDVELGTRHRKTCSPEIRTWLKKQFEQWADSFTEKRPIIGMDQHFVGDSSKAFHRHGTDSYLGYGEHFNTVQIEFSHWLRLNYRKEVLDLLNQVVSNFNDFIQS